MKKLLLIQTDDAYFLFETLQVVEKFPAVFKQFDLTVLANEQSLKRLQDGAYTVIKGITTDSAQVQSGSYDISVNLSLNEESWDFHSSITSSKKIGAYKKDGQLIVEDLWSSYLLTLKAKAPFLTFHLQDVYKNILGIKGRVQEPPKHGQIKQIAMGATAHHLFTPEEQEKLAESLALRFPRIPLKDISEVDLVEDVSETLYIGPATLDALTFCEAGGRGVFLTSAFQGFNLLPYGDSHYLISSRGEKFKAANLFRFIEKLVLNEPREAIPYSVYTFEHEYIFGAFLQSDNQSDDNYPFYQSHVVLWNYLLNLFDTNLEIISCTPGQINLLKVHHEVLKKLIRLHDYAMTSIDSIYQESRSATSDANKLQGHINNLIDIEKISDQIAGSHPFLRPVLDFYRIRRGQNDGSTLLEQSQNSLLTYSEEHQALTALDELFSVTLRKNEVSI